MCSKVQFEVLSVSFLGCSLQLSSVKAALVRHFSCSEFELRTRVATALDASSMETTHIIELWGPLVASLLLLKVTAHHSSLIGVVS